MNFSAKTVTRRIRPKSSQSSHVPVTGHGPPPHMGRDPLTARVQAKLEGDLKTDSHAFRGDRHQSNALSPLGDAARLSAQSTASATPYQRR